MEDKEIMAHISELIATEHALREQHAAGELTGAQERACTLEELYEADEVFLASTVREVQTVASIDDREYPDPSPVSDRTRETVSARIAEQLRG